MQQRRTLSQYSGGLTTTQAAEGIQAALRNGRALLADARLLLDKGRWKRAAALAILAVEEGGKTAIIREILLARDQRELKEAWQSYRTHARKNLMYILPALVARGARHLDDFREIYNQSSDHGQLLDSVKQIAFYSDACGVCHWSIPEEVISPALAKDIVAIAGFLVREGPQPLSTKEELDIWVKHMSPVWKGELIQMKKALIACYAEARAKGVLQGSTSEIEMMDFLFAGPGSSPS